MIRPGKGSLISVSALALLAGSIMAGSAFAQAPSVLQPKGGWSVTKMDRPSNGAGAYCALARQYEKDIIFTLGRNMTDEYSLAVDFQKDQMDTDKPYKLTLSPGAGQTRAFDLLPLSSRAMVIRLGWDESFFKALDSSRMLRVGIGDVDYSFNMPDIASGQKDLQACVDGLKETAKALGADGEQQVANNDVLNAEAGAAAGFSARKGEAEETAGAAPKAKPAPAPLEMADAVPAPEVKALPPGKPLPPSAPQAAAPSKDMLAEMATLRAENQRLKNAMEDQREKLAASYDKAQDENALAEMEEKVRLLEKENARLSAGGAAGTVTQAAATAPAAATTAAAATRPEDKAKLENLERLVNDLKAENRDMKQQLAAAATADKMPAVPAPAAMPLSMSEDPPESEKVQALQKQLADTEAEKVKLQGQLETARKQSEDKQVASAKAGGDMELEKAVRRYNEAEREIERLGKILEQERNTKQADDTDGKKQAQRVALLEKELKKVKDEQASITVKEKANSDKLAKDLEAANAARQNAERDNANMKIEVEQLKTALASTKQAVGEEAAAELSTLQNRIMESEKQRDALDEQNKQLKAELEKAKINTAQADAQGKAQAELQAQLKSTQDQYRKAQDKLAAMEEENRKLRASAALAAYKPEETALNDAEPAAGFEPPPLQPVAAVQPVSAPVRTVAAYGESDVKSLISRANIPVKGKVRKAGDGAYTWTSDNLKGRAEISSAEAGFAQQVDQHINKAKSQCKGDFAAIPSAQGANTANFEVACVGASGGTSSSYAFFEDKGSFVAVSVETNAENMDVAMDTRDRIAAVK